MLVIVRLFGTLVVVVVHSVSVMVQVYNFSVGIAAVFEVAHSVARIVPLLTVIGKVMTDSVASGKLVHSMMMDTGSVRRVAVGCLVLAMMQENEDRGR